MHTADGLNIPIFDGSTDKTTGTPVNLASAWLDGSVIYGISAEHESKLRTVFKFPVDYIDDGDGCWRRNILATTLRCW